MDTAKGVSIILVVYYHAIMFAGRYEIDILPFYKTINWPMLLVRMPLFFVLSALLMSSKLDEGWDRYARKYLLPVIWLYVIWDTLYLLTMGRPLIQTVTALVLPSDIVTHLWFLWALVMFRVAAKLLDRVRLPALAVTALVSFLTFGGHIGQDLTFVEINLLKYPVFFLASVWYGRAVFAHVTSRPRLYAAGMLVIFAGMWMMKERLGIAASGVIAAVAISAIISDKVPVIARVLSWFGRHSLAIFILHFWIVRGLMQLTDGLPGSPIWGVPAVTLVAVLASILIRHLTDRIAPFLFVLPVQFLAGLRPTRA